MDNKNDLNELYEEDTLGQKFTNGIKSNINYIIITIVALAFIGLCYVKLEQQLDWRTLFAHSAVGILVGSVIKSLLGQEGSQKGFASKKHQEVQDKYNKKVEDNNPHSEYYDLFCDLENEAKIKKYRIQVLSKHNLVYQKFIDGDYDNKDYYINKKGEKVKYTNKQKIALNKARNPNIVYISANYLTNESTLSVDQEKKEIATRKYISKRNFTLVLSACISAVLFGMFTPTPVQGQPIAQAIWNAIQVLIYVSTGFMEYSRRYNWVTNDHCSYLNRRCDYLTKFENMYNNKNSELWKRVHEIEQSQKEEDVKGETKDGIIEKETNL